MNRLVLCLLPVLLAFALQSPQADSAEATTALVARIQQHYDQLHSLQADFLQVTRSRAARLGTTAHGTLYFLKPGAMRWDYKEPSQRFVLNGAKAWLYVPQEKTIYLYRVGQLVRASVVLNFLSGVEKLRKLFRIRQLPPAPGPPLRYRLELRPREPDSAIARVVLWVEPKLYRVVRIQTEDPLGNINLISLSNIQENRPLKPSWFALEIPEGVRLEHQEFSPP